MAEKRDEQPDRDDSDNEQRKNRNTPQGQGGPGGGGGMGTNGDGNMRMSRSMLGWILIVAIIILLFVVFHSKDGTPAEKDLTTFWAAVDRCVGEGFLHAARVDDGALRVARDERLEFLLAVDVDQQFAEPLVVGALVLQSAQQVSFAEQPLSDQQLPEFSRPF